MGKGFIFLNYKYEQRDYYYILHSANTQAKPHYEYYSKKFDMEYCPRAEHYNRNLLMQYPTYKTR